MKFFNAILTIGLFAGLAFSGRAELADGVKVVVHNSIVTYLQVEEATGMLIDESMLRRYANDPRGFEQARNRLVDENTERLVERELILRDFEASGFSVPESVIDDYLQQQIRRDFNGNRAIMAKTLQAEGRTLEKYREQVRTQFIVSQMRLKNISDAIMISPHKIEVYYVAHTNDFQVEDQIKLRMIVLNKSADDPGQARRLAEEILSKIQGGASFAEMATAYSQDSRRSQGGSWDWERTSVLRKEFADAAAALKTGEHSSIIDAPEACYIMLVEDKRPAHIRPLSEVRDDIESTLLREERQRLENQWISRLKKKTFVRYF